MAQLTSSEARRSASLTLVVRLVAAAAGFLLHLVLARSMSVDAYGLYSYLFSVCAVLAFFGRAGIPGALVRFLPKYAAHGEHSSFGGIFAFSIGVALMLGITSAEFSGIVLSGQTDEIRDAARLVILASVLLAVFEGALRGLKKSAASLVGDGVMRPLVLLFYVVLFAGDAGSPTAGEVLRASGFAAVVACVWAIALLVRVVARAELFGRPEFSEWQEWSMLMLTLLWTGLIGLVQARSDILLLGMLSESEEVAYYSVAIRLATILAIPLQAVNAFVSPRIAEHWASDEAGAGREYLQRLVSRMALAASALTMPAAVVLLLLGEPILSVFGSEYSNARLPLFMLVVGQTCNCFCGSVMFLLTMTGNHRVAAITSTVAMIGNISLSAALIPKFGATGAALATSGTLVAQNLALLAIVRGRLGVDPTPIHAIRTLRSESPIDS